MASLDVEVDGIEDVKEAINEFSGKADDEVENELENTAVEIQNEARRTAPKENSTLARGYQHSVRGKEVIVFNDVEYAPRIEFGFVGEDSIGRTYDQSGFFVLTRASENQIDNFRDRLVDRINDIE